MDAQALHFDALAETVPTRATASDVSRSAARDGRIRLRSVAAYAGTAQRDDDLAVSDRADGDLVAGAQSGDAHGLYGERYPVLG